LRARLNAGARIVAMQGELVEKTRSLGDALDEIRALYGAIDADLDEARRLQQSLLKNTQRTYPEAEVSLWLQASGHVGGDMVGFFEAYPDMLGFYALDVSGHGVAAAMVVARAAGMLSDAVPERNIALSPYGDGLYAPLPPDLVAARLNAQLLRELRGERYLTICFGHLDRSSGIVRMVQAGHPNPIILRAGGEVEVVGSGGLPLGLLPEASHVGFSFRLSPGDRLLLHSDGFTECADGDGALLDEAGLVASCRRHAGLAGADMLSAIAADLAEHAGGSDFSDDVSALLLSYFGR
jgi:sigma-B regulation protein RsbU (phosphoserine phosphatase)